MTGQTSDVTSISASTDWTSYTKTVTVPAGTTQITVGFSFTPTGTAGTNDWFEVAEVQFERGSVATPFEHRSFGEELALCQRYFERMLINTGIRNGTFSQWSNEQYQADIYYKVRKRDSPTVTYVSYQSNITGTPWVTRNFEVQTTVEMHKFTARFFASNEYFYLNTLDVEDEL